MDVLQPLFDEGWIDQVIRPVKSGKEASVYLCRGAARAGDKLVAAKVYRAREDRTFKNDSQYWDGGMRMMGRRVRLAATKRTAFGKEVRFATWVNREQETLEMLHRAGARVPRPIAQLGSVLLMSWIGDEEQAAPQLRQVNLESDRAGRMLDFLLGQVEIWLSNNIVHGDLSEYNILFWRGRPVVIDFPQAVDPRFNHHAHSLLGRDVDNLLRAFRKMGVVRDAGDLVAGMWGRWLNADPEFASYLDPAPQSLQEASQEGLGRIERQPR